jgi:hypothetical protein
MSAQQQLHVIDESTVKESPKSASSLGFDVDDIQEPTSLYKQATDEPIIFPDRDGRRFLAAVVDEIGKEDDLSDARVLDDLEDPDDVDFGELLVFPDESLLFIGSDPTARDSIPLFAFVVERYDPIPAPTTAQEALNLLRPAEIQAAFDGGGSQPDRQGEWWLLPTKKLPVSDVYDPGVGSRPFGPSPLGNHVPREYGFGVTENEFMDAVRDGVSSLPSSVTTPPEVIEWVSRQHSKEPVPDYAPTWDKIRRFAGEIYVRGTLRHRDNDHYVEKLGKQWHQAQTHNMDVYTGDDMIDRVRID